MNEVEEVKKVVKQWLDCLDAGDLEGMIETCDPEIVVANEGQPTTVGIEAVRNKYAPRIASANFCSEFDVEHIAVYGDFALMVGHFSVEVTDKVSGNKNIGKGRLGLNYRKHNNGSWKMVFDMDNNS